MNAADGASAAATPREGLAAQLRQLEAFVARAESDGDALPPEAMEMVARLREIMHALNGLSSTFDELSTPSPNVSSESPEPS